MAIQHTCDRCAQPITGLLFQLTLQQHKQNERYAAYNGLPLNTDLCLECAQSYKGWLESDPSAGDPDVLDPHLIDYAGLWRKGVR